MNRIQIKNHRIGSNEINQISLFCFDSKIYIFYDGIDVLSLDA